MTKLCLPDNNESKLKRTAIYILLILLSLNLYSQDLIITSGGDSVKCKIIRFKDDKIHIVINENGKIKNAVFPMSQIKRYEKGVLTNTIYDNVLFDDYPDFKFAISAGFSQRSKAVPIYLNNISSSYSNNLKYGFNTSVDIIYFINDMAGFGFKYSLFRAKNEKNDFFIIQQSGTNLYGKQKNDISINMAGPEFNFRILSKDRRNNFFINLYLGYVLYKDNGAMIDDYIVKGSTAGAGIDAGYDIELWRNLSIGVEFSYITSLLTHYKIENVTNNNYLFLKESSSENLNRAELSVGLRFTL